MVDGDLTPTPRLSGLSSTYRGFAGAFRGQEHRSGRGGEQQVTPKPKMRDPDGRRSCKAAQSRLRRAGGGQTALRPPTLSRLTTASGSIKRIHRPWSVLPTVLGCSTWWRTGPRTTPHCSIACPFFPLQGGGSISSLTSTSGFSRVPTCDGSHLLSSCPPKTTKNHPTPA